MCCLRIFIWEKNSNGITQLVLCLYLWQYCLCLRSNNFNYLKILSDNLLPSFCASVEINSLDDINIAEETPLQIDYYNFYNAISSVYSSKIEGEAIELDSFFKHKFLNVSFQQNYTEKTDDLFSAYQFIFSHNLTYDNVIHTHQLISQHLLPSDQQGKIRTNLMYVVNKDGGIEYVAATPNIIQTELIALFEDIQFLLNEPLDFKEVFYYAAYIHLAFVKIHPFQDGNGRTARLLEKWFLKEKLGEKAMGIQLEKNYFNKLELYYSNIKNIGVEYIALNFEKAISFLLMTISSLH